MKRPFQISHWSNLIIKSSDVSIENRDKVLDLFCEVEGGFVADAMGEKLEQLVRFCQDNKIEFLKFEPGIRHMHYGKREKLETPGWFDYEIEPNGTAYGWFLDEGDKKTSLVVSFDRKAFIEARKSVTQTINDVNLKDPNAWVRILNAEIDLFEKWVRSNPTPSQNPYQERQSVLLHQVMAGIYLRLYRGCEEGDFVEAEKIQARCVHAAKNAIESDLHESYKEALEEFLFQYDPKKLRRFFVPGEYRPLYKERVEALRSLLWKEFGERSSLLIPSILKNADGIVEQLRGEKSGPASRELLLFVDARDNFRRLC